jgi:hypothetical protein
MLGIPPSPPQTVRSLISALISACDAATRCGWMWTDRVNARHAMTYARSAYRSALTLRMRGRSVPTRVAARSRGAGGWCSEASSAVDWSCQRSLPTALTMQPRSLAISSGGACSWRARSTVRRAGCGQQEVVPLVHGDVPRYPIPCGNRGSPNDPPPPLGPKGASPGIHTRAPPGGSRDTKSARAPCHTTASYHRARARSAGRVCGWRRSGLAGRAHRSRLGLFLGERRRSRFEAGRRQIRLHNAGKVLHPPSLLVQ